MIPRQKIRELAEKLLKKTRAKQVKWTHSDENEYECVLRLPHSSFAIRFESPVAEPDKVIVKLNREDEYGPMVVTDLTVNEGEEDWEVFRSLYDETSRLVYGWDKVLDELQTAVSGSGLIGEDAE